MGIYFRDIFLIRISRGANNCGQHSLEKNIYFIMRFSPHFQLFYFNDRLEFCEFFEGKIKRINNADLFSQPPLLIFIKGANISEGHCISQLRLFHTILSLYLTVKTSFNSDFLSRMSLRTAILFFFPCHGIKNEKGNSDFFSLQFWLFFSQLWVYISILTFLLRIACLYLGNLFKSHNSELLSYNSDVFSQNYEKLSKLWDKSCNLPF